MAKKGEKSNQKSKKSRKVDEKKEKNTQKDDSEKEPKVENLAKIIRHKTTLGRQFVLYNVLYIMFWDKFCPNCGQKFKFWFKKQMVFQN